jgi:hypothetical protein
MEVALEQGGLGYWDLGSFFLLSVVVDVSPMAYMWSVGGGMAEKLNHFTEGFSTELGEIVKAGSSGNCNGSCFEIITPKCVRDLRHV